MGIDAGIGRSAKSEKETRFYTVIHTLLFREKTMHFLNLHFRQEANPGITVYTSTAHVSNTRASALGTHIVNIHSNSTWSNIIKKKQHSQRHTHLNHTHSIQISSIFHSNITPSKITHSMLSSGPSASWHHWQQCSAHSNIKSNCGKNTHSNRTLNNSTRRIT